MVLAALAIVWIVVLGSYAKDRLAGRRRDTVSSFRTQLSTLERTRPGYAPLHRSSAMTSGIRCETARCRRRNALFILAGLAGTSLVVALAAPVAVTVVLAVVCTLAFTGYVALLAQRQRIIAEQQTKVRRLDARRPVARPVRQRPTLVASARR